MTRWVGLGLGLGSVLLVACGGGTARTRTADDVGADDTMDDASDAEAQCRIATTPIGAYRLPSLPEEFDLLEPAHREAWDATMAMFDREAPPAPEEPTTEAVQAWAAGPFSTFVGESTDLLHTAEAHLNGLADGPGPVQAVASTLVGLMYYHLANQMLGAPVPTEVAQDPELRAVYLSSIRQGVQPLLDTAAARAEYCIYAAASQPEEMHRWRVYCYSLIGHTVVQERRLTSLVRAADRQAHTPEYAERRWGTAVPGARVTPGRAEVTGELAPEQVTSFLAAHPQPLAACYQRGLAQDEHLHGQVVMSFRVGRRGATDDVEATVSTLDAPDVTQCLVTAVDQLTFPRPASGTAQVFVALDLRVIPISTDAEAGAAEGTAEGEAAADDAAAGEAAASEAASE